MKAGQDPSIYPQDYKEIWDYIGKHRKSMESYEFVKSMYTIKDKGHDSYIHEFIDFGASWLLEAFWPGRCSLKEIQERIEKGPPE